MRKAKADLVDDFKATPFGFDKYQRGVKPADLQCFMEKVATSNRVMH